MEEITSVNNQLVKETAKLQQKKYRDLSDKFILEGYKAIEEAAKSAIELDYLFVLPQKADKYKFFDGRKILTNEAVLKRCRKQTQLRKLSQLQDKNIIQNRILKD